MERSGGHERAPAVPARGRPGQRTAPDQGAARPLVPFLTPLLDFNRPSARRNALLALLAAAFLSPNIDMPAGLPAIRLEQLLLAALLPSLLLFVREHSWARRITVVDAAFAAMLAATLITLALAPFVLSTVVRSVRDGFELARIFEYWFLFRLAMTVTHEVRTGRLLLTAIAVAAIFSGLFALAQYLGSTGFNEAIAGIWAVNHNLDALVRTGRTVGTVGNPNMFGILSGLLLVTSIAALLLRVATDNLRWLLVAAVAGATLAVVLSQSRTAVFALLGAMFVALLVVAWFHRREAAYGLAVGSFLGSTVLSVGFVELVPPETGTFHDRFSPAGFSSDASLNLRLDKWKALFAGFFEEEPDFCIGATVGEGRLPTNHDPDGRTTGAPPASAEAIARDDQRKEDVATINRGILDYFCANEGWPTGAPLDELLVPEHLDAMPVDPADGSPYPATVTGGGYTIGARLEDPSDPFGPIYTRGTLPSIILNPSMEAGDGTPGRWTADRGASVERTTEAALFADHGARVTFEDGGNFFHLLVFDFAPNEQHTVSAWVRSPEPGALTQAQIYLVATFTDGRVADPYDSQTFDLPADGSWTQIALTFDTQEDDPIPQLQIILRAPDAAPGSMLDVDGISLARGTFAQSFPYVRVLDPATLRSRNLPDFADSPLIGVGPRNNLNLSAVDNEYALFLDQYGVVGTLAYLALWAAMAWLALRAWRQGQGITAALGLGLATYLLALGVFNVAAGSYYNFQVMAIFWLVAGYVAGFAIQPRVGRRG